MGTKSKHGNILWTHANAYWLTKYAASACFIHIAPLSKTSWHWPNINSPKESAQSSFVGAGGYVGHLKSLSEARTLAFCV